MRFPNNNSCSDFGLGALTKCAFLLPTVVIMDLRSFFLRTYAFQTTAAVVKTVVQTVCFFNNSCSDAGLELSQKRVCFPSTNCSDSSGLGGTGACVCTFLRPTVVVPTVCFPTTAAVVVMLDGLGFSEQHVLSFHQL